jgi:hypothetical protein
MVPFPIEDDDLAPNNPDSAPSQSPNDGENEAMLQELILLLNQARAFKDPLDKKLTQWRAYFDMQPPQPPFKDALTAAVPIIRQKADGIRAHLKVAIDKEPMFSARPYTSEAADVAPVLESLLERELRMSDSKHEIEKAIDEAVLYGTGILKLDTNYEGYVQLKHIPFKNVWAWPDKYDPKLLSWFVAFWQPYHEIKRLGDEGYYDKGAVEDLATVASGGGYYTNEIMSTPAVNDEVRWHELIEAWWIRNGRLQRIIFAPLLRKILRIDDTPFEGLVECPPFFPIYIDPDPISIWGHGLAEILESAQVVADAALNQELWSGQYKMRPPVLVRQSSQVWRILSEKGGLYPGQLIPFEGGDAEEVIKPMEYGMNPFNAQMLHLMQQLTEDATISDFIVPGQPLGGRKTATEIGVTATIGQLKLANYLRYVQRSLEAAIKVYWDVLEDTRVSNAQDPNLPPGVTKVYSYSGGGAVYVADKTVKFNYPTPEGVMEVSIAGADRDDMDFVLTGSITAPERELRVQRISQVLNPAMLQIINAARQDPGIAVLVRRFLDAIGFSQDADLILNPPEQGMSPGEAVLQGVSQGLEQRMAQGNKNG